MAWDDYDIEYPEEQMTLDRHTSAMDGPKLMRGFSFNIMGKDEIEFK